MRNFEKFEGQGRKVRRNFPVVTISTAGLINFNAVFHEKYPELKGRRVLFLYDRKEKVVGLRIIYGTKPNSYPLGEQKNGMGYYVCAKAFLRFYDIPHEKPRSYRVTLEKPVNSGHYFFTFEPNKPV